MSLPLVEQGAELVCGGTPVGVVAEFSGQRFGLFHNRGTFLDRLGDRLLAAVGQFFLLGGALRLELLELRLQCRYIADNGRLLGFFAQQLDGFVNLTGLDCAGVQTVCEHIQLFFEVKESAGVQCQRFLFRSVGELSDFAFAVTILDIHRAIVVDAAERFGLLDAFVGIGDVRGRRCRGVCGLPLGERGG